MKLSEAIRLGSALRPQVFGAYFKFLPRQAARTSDSSTANPTYKHILDLGSCALGAAAEAIGCEASDAISEPNATTRLNCTFPLLRAHVKCPMCLSHTSVAGIISHLNDDHGQTREQIAAWVESVEAGLKAGLEVHRLMEPEEVPA